MSGKQSPGAGLLFCCFPLVFLFSGLSSDFLVFSSSLSSPSSSSLLVLPLLLLFVLLILILVRRLLLVLFYERNGFLAATSQFL